MAVSSREAMIMCNDGAEWRWRDRHLPRVARYAREEGDTLVGTTRPAARGSRLVSWLLGRAVEGMALIPQLHQVVRCGADVGDRVPPERRIVLDHGARAVRWPVLGPPGGHWPPALPEDPSFIAVRAPLH